MNKLTLINGINPEPVKVEDASDMYISEGLLSFEFPWGTLSFITGNVESIVELNELAALEYLKDECECNLCADCPCENGLIDTRDLPEGPFKWWNESAQRRAGHCLPAEDVVTNTTDEPCNCASCRAAIRLGIPEDEECDCDDCLDDERCIEDGPELGEASLLVKLSKGSIEVSHGSIGGVILRKSLAREGDWDKLIEFFRDSGYERVKWK